MLKLAEINDLYSEKCKIQAFSMAFDPDCPGHTLTVGNYVLLNLFIDYCKTKLNTVFFKRTPPKIKAGRLFILMKGFSIFQVNAYHKVFY